MISSGLYYSSLHYFTFIVIKLEPISDPSASHAYSLPTIQHIYVNITNIRNNLRHIGARVILKRCTELEVLSTPLRRIS